MAAGMGTRFGQMTEKIPKGFIPYNGIPMVVRSIRTLIDCGIDRIIILYGLAHRLLGGGAYALIHAFFDIFR